MREREPVCDRVVLRSVRPSIDGGRSPLRRVAGEVVQVEAEVFAFGDEAIRCALRYRPAAEAPEGTWREVAMAPTGVFGALGAQGPLATLAPIPPLAPRTWRASFEVPTPGLWHYDVAAWVDDFATWQGRLEREGAAAGFEAGARLLQRAAESASAQGRAGHAKVLTGLARTLLAEGDAAGERLRLALDGELAPLVDRFLGRPFVTTLPQPLEVVVEAAERATRSWFVLAGGGDDPVVQLPAAVAMGFDAVVLPCPGFLEPFGAGSAGEAPMRGALEAARSQGLTAALELPFRFRADHPLRAERPAWVREASPGWVELDLAGEDWQALWRALAWALAVWAGEGVEIFFVARPEAAPPGFWAWLLAEAREKHPDLAFWAPAPERREVRDHLRSRGLTLYHPLPALLTIGEVRELWAGKLFLSLAPAAPIVPLAGVSEDGSGASESLFLSLERSALAGMVLAATGAASYGLSGLAADSPRGKELARLVERLNQLRRARPVFAGEGALRILPTDEPELFCYGSLRGKDSFIVVLSLDEARARSSWIELPLAELGLKEEAVFHVEDLLSGVRYLWQGRRNHVRIDPADAPAQVLRLVR